MITSVLRNIFRVNLAVRKTERCLVFTDRTTAAPKPGPSDIGRTRLQCLAYLASEVGSAIAGEMRFCEFPATGGHGIEPPVELWEAAFGKPAIRALTRRRILPSLLGKRGDVRAFDAASEIIRKHRADTADAVVALSYYSTSHTSFRRLLTDICATRYASMPLFEAAMLDGPMSVDWKRLGKVTRTLSARLSRADRLEVTTGNGSQLSFSVRGRKALADTGLLTRPGNFGNLPAGESFIAPVEGTANGKLVLAWAPTRELASPVTLTVRGGAVITVSGREPYAQQLGERLAERPENASIAEFGMGTNERARRPDNILESEKILGTVHFALGDNSSFGGTISTPFHQDFVFFRPTVLLLRKDGGRDLVMKDGSLQGERDD